MAAISAIKRRMARKQPFPTLTADSPVACFCMNENSFTILLFPGFADLQNTKLPYIFLLDAIAQGAVLLFQRQFVKAPAVYSIGLGPVFENLFAKVRVADPFHLPLITPGSGIRLLVGTLLVYDVAFSEDLKGKKDKTEQCG
jgi:hypothetical protein